MDQLEVCHGVCLLCDAESDSVVVGLYACVSCLRRIYLRAMAWEYVSFAVVSMDRQHAYTGMTSAAVRVGVN